ncbi:Uncharacterized protein Adt_40174 [Abeliophyllum distichum]|uniref:Endonuclease/exonuclease/phosphatase domain-containing protein n=1 Tax=Abeliophyllum distichum TaxID=126358 RepID=A0ABD1Q771_9LAMI
MTGLKFARDGVGREWLYMDRPTSEHVPPVATFLASKPVTADTTCDPLLDHMMSVPRERQESDGFTTVQRKKSSKGDDIPRPSTRVTRSQAVASCVDHPQFLHIRVEDPRLSRPMYITPVYASCSPAGRRDLWMGLHQISLVVDGPWMVGGDFNVIAHNGERTGHNTRDRGTSDFADMMMDCGLTDAGYSGSQYTWTNGRVWKRLDRVLINSAVGSSCSRFSVRHLNRSTSDHSPLLIQWSSDDDLGPRPFRFLNVWSRHHEFLSFQVRDAECRVDEAESVYDSDPTPAHRDTLHQAQAGLNQTLSVEEAFWKQKAGARWVCEGDHNTRYFHSMVQGRRIRSRIRSITSETGEVFDSQETIQPSAVSFFQELLSAAPQPVDPIRPDIIPRLVSDEDNL